MLLMMTTVKYTVAGKNDMGGKAVDMSAKGS